MILQSYNPIIQYLEMINNPIAATLQQKILAQMAELHKKKAPEEKISYIKLNQKQEEEAEELFDLVQPIDKAERKRNQGKGKTEDEKAEEEEEEQEQEEEEQEEEEKPKVEENKFISILKKTEKGKQLIEGTKKVTFADQPESYLVTQSGRKWNEKLRTQRKGKFDPAQKRLLIQNLSQCLSQANLSYDEVVRTMSEDEEKIPRNLNFWTKVCSILPDRTLVSSYKFLKRELNTKNKGGEWTEDETNLLIQLVEKVGRKWSLIAKEMHRSAENVRDKYRLIGEQKYDPNSEQTVWKFAELVQFLAYIQKYSKVQFLDPQISTQLQSHQQHDQLQLQQLKTRRYNSKTFTFHNNTVARRYIKKQFNSLKIESINWQKISDKLGTKTIFDCRNKFVQLLQLEICGMGSQEYYQGKIVDFVLGLRVRYQGEIDWGKWTEEGISGEEARNRWMILKRHVQGRGQKTFQQLMAQLAQKYSKKQK